MWSPTTRRRYGRAGPRYASDLTDAGWALIEPLLPAAGGRGRPRSWSWREILDATFYALRGGIAWRLPPTDFPPWQTTYRWFATWRDAGPFRGHRPCPGHGRPRTGRAGGEPDGRRDGRPVGQGHRGRRATGR